MNVLQKLLQPTSRWVQGANEAVPNAPTKEFYRYMLQLESKVRELEARVKDLESP